MGQMPLRQNVSRLPIETDTGAVTLITIETGIGAVSPMAFDTLGH